ncbi:MAG: hypothetical protein ACE5GE_00950 [Phycisphaerae bacterium]
MTDMDRQIKATQRRLWINAWLDLTCWALTGASGAFAAVVVGDRLFDLGWPLGWIALWLTGAGLFIATCWSVVTRASEQRAAAALDEAAGLRERISTGLHCRTTLQHDPDPFAQAVVSDAERTSRLVTVRMHIRLRAPFALVYAGLACTAAALLLLLPAGLLIDDAVDAARDNGVEVRRTQAQVKKRFDKIKKVAQTNPALKELKEKLEAPDQGPQAGVQTPESVRNEALKKIDKLSDALREQQKSERFKTLQRMKKTLRGLKAPANAKTPVQKLTKALAEGNLKVAQEQIKTLQEQLAKLKSPEDAQKLALTKKQLEALAKKLSKLSDNKRLKQQLQQSGLKKEDIERMLRHLSKKDLDQARKQLQKKGLSQKQIDKLLKQLQQQQQNSAMAQKMAQAMKQAADAAAAGQSDQASQMLQGAGDQLSEMEMMEQEMAQIDSMLAELQSASNDLDACGRCGGKGCSSCQGTGQGQSGGMGKLGQGRGGRATEQQTATRFKTHRQKVQTTKGRIIGQFLVDGQQVKGDVNSEFVEVLSAEQRDATDLIHRDRIPRQYHKSVRDYFSSVQEQIGADASKPEAVESAESSDSTGGGQ